MIGSALLCVSYIISSRAENVQLLLFSHGVVQGRTSLVIIYFFYDGALCRTTHCMRKRELVSLL